ncbi:MAG: PQQ-dependent sugar dehydrogenase [Balneolaceae bacterium]
MNSINRIPIQALLIFTVSVFSLYSCSSGDSGDDPFQVPSEMPSEGYFTKTELIEGGTLTEPTEMTILPNLDILIAQRRGEILLYNQESGTLSDAGFLDVYWQTEAPGVNAEEGVIGIQADPDFESNNFIFIFYTPADTSVNRISRFLFTDGTIDMESETVVLEFYSDRHICCHTGGSLAFDSEGLLYASTGDNATPFNQRGEPYVLGGYAPLDERPGFEQYDARRTSGNSSDLRGKILRIRVLEDGSYEIPEGNLYPQGMEMTRPEIYVQGTRNPYRISVDPKSGFLYWGEVGPDAANDSLGIRGPMGYDEINQAREAGHYGWPFFVGENRPYNEYDFNTGVPGEMFDPEQPLNRSPNNTGLTELPPAEPAFIAYPYSRSEQFPILGSGGRNAMAGPVFYRDLYPEATRLPDFFHGKLFIYDWIRDWIMVVTLNEDGDLVKLEPFMEESSFFSISDMELGPDGRLYLLEYGKGWFSRNPDSGLSRIDVDPDFQEAASAAGNGGEEQDGESAPEGHQAGTVEVEGRELAMTLDCRACHLESGSSIGPSYEEIAERYQNEQAADERLVRSILQGSSGIWGNANMPAHPAMSEVDALKIIAWIRSLEEGGGE